MCRGTSTFEITGTTRESSKELFFAAIKLAFLHHGPHRERGKASDLMVKFYKEEKIPADEEFVYVIENAPIDTLFMHDNEISGGSKFLAPLDAKDAAQQAWLWLQNRRAPDLGHWSDGIDEIGWRVFYHWWLDNMLSKNGIYVFDCVVAIQPKYITFGK